MKRRLSLFLLAGALAFDALAHRLAVDWQVVGNALVLHGRVDEAPAAGADVELLSNAGTTLAAGQLGPDGTYTWPIATTNDVTIVVNAGLGHRRTLTLTAAELRGAASKADLPPAAPAVPDSRMTASPQAAGGSDGTSELGLRVVLGLTFLFAATGAWLGYRNSRRLDMLERELRRHASRG
jgi:hypothetical protein